MEDRPDNVLVEQAVRGDGESFTELCRRYYAPLVAIGHAILGDRHLAEDAAQEAFAKAAVHLPKLRKANQFGRWVAAICRNEARDLARARQRYQIKDEMATEGVCEKRHGHPAREILRHRHPADDSWAGCPCHEELSPHTPSEETPARADETSEFVRIALQGLPEEAREVLFLRFYDGLSYDQISAVLGISEQAINGRLRRAKRKLVELLRHSGFDEVEL